MRAILSLILLTLTLVSKASIRPLDFIKYDGSPKVRVRIAKSLGEIVVSGTDLDRTIYLKKEKKTYSGRKSIKFNCENLRLSEREDPVLLAGLTSPTGLIGLADQKYKGDIHIVTSSSQQKCDVINEIDTEYYISSLLPKEMHSSWPIEALKAQAIAARTYALHKIASKQVARSYGKEVFFDLENSEKHQVNGHFFDSTPSTHKAAFETKGHILLTKEGLLTPTFFHAKCGGITWRPDQVWDNVVEGHRSVSCPFCKHHGNKNWEGRISKSKFVRFLNWLRKKGHLPHKTAFTTKDTIKIVPRFTKSSTLQLYLGDRPLLFKKALFRRYFGRVQIQSNNWNLQFDNKTLVLKGRGKGHGVGMCQFGALDLAKRGWNHQQILAHYFPEHRSVKVYQ